MHQAKIEPEDDPVTDMLYQRYATTIFTYVHQHISSREDAEDILVETFLAALEAPTFMQLSEKEQVSWLWRVARNKVVDSYRKSTRRHNIPLEQISETVYEDEEQGPEQALLRQEAESQTLALLKRLPPGHQEVMLLRFGHGLRSAEIASIIGKRESAVRTTISRAMNLLRKIYEERKEAQ
jgi:RNA polymerase sigma factor (sigma-70 family)